VSVLVSQAYVFGSGVYPYINPYFGGAAVREVYVRLKPETPEELQRAIKVQPMPLLDLDDNFLYVIACPERSSGGRPETVMIPLGSIASAGIASNRARFLAVPAYVDSQRCA